MFWLCLVLCGWCVMVVLVCCFRVGGRPRSKPFYWAAASGVYKRRTMDSTAVLQSLAYGPGSACKLCAQPRQMDSAAGLAALLLQTGELGKTCRQCAREHSSLTRRTDDWSQAPAALKCWSTLRSCELYRRRLLRIISEEKTHASAPRAQCARVMVAAVAVCVCVCVCDWHRWQW